MEHTRVPHCQILPKRKCLIYNFFRKCIHIFCNMKRKVPFPIFRRTRNCLKKKSHNHGGNGNILSDGLNLLSPGVLFVVSWEIKCDCYLHSFELVGNWVTLTVKMGWEMRLTEKKKLFQEGHAHWDRTFKKVSTNLFHILT